MNRFIKSLSVKIIIVVIAVELLVLFVLGGYYTRKFNKEIDSEIIGQITLPGALMTKGELSFSAVADMKTMESLLREPYVDGMVFGLDHRIYYSLYAERQDKQLLSIDGRSIKDLSIINTDSIGSIKQNGNAYLTCLTPLRLDGKLVGYLYVKVSNQTSAAAKRAVAIQFALGSIFSILVTSSLLIILMNLLITRRITKMAEAFHRFSQGDLSARARPAGGGDEIADLAKSFNGLADRLQQTIENLTESESLLRGTFDNAPFEFWVRDLKGRCIMENNVLVRHWGTLLGTTPEEAPIPQDELAIWQENNRRAYAGEIVDAEVRFVHSGQQIYYHNIIAPIRINGEIRSILGINIDITERKLAEERLHKSEMLLKEIQKISKVGGWQYDALANSFTWTDETYRIYGVSHEFDMSDLKRNIDFYLPQYRARVSEAFQRAVENGESYDLEAQFLAADGVSKWVRTMGSPVTKDGQTILVVGNIIDITERKQAEESLRESEANLREAQEIARMGQWKFDLIDNHLVWSAGIFSLFEIDQESFGASYEAFLEGVHPDDRANVDKAYRDSVENHKPYEIEHRLLMRDGRVKWVNEIGRTEYDNEGRPLRSKGTVQDITKRKQTEEALKESEEKLRLMFERSPIGMALCEMDGTLVDANQAYLNIIGYTLVEAKKLTYWNITPKEYAKDEERQLLSMERIGRYGPYEKEYIRKSGERALVLLNGVLITGADGVKRIWSLVEDITERKRGEKENAKLEAQLQQAQKMESVGRLAGGVAHDFNNMLQTILGYTDIALEEADPQSPMCESLLEIQKAAQRSADLTRQLLAFARKQTVNPKVLDLNDAVAGMLKMLHRLIGENIELVWKPGIDTWSVKIDPSQLDQILANLSVNARDAIAGGGNLVIETENIVIDETYVSTHVGFITGQYVVLSVSDTGSGMDKETIEHLFEPFYTTKGVGKGTGLGLATVYGVITQNHGYINVYSEPGKGTTFRIYLPRAYAVGEAESVAVTQEPPRGNETILIAEDEEAILKFGKSILERFGYTVLAAQTPDEALKLAQRHKGPIHLLITDVVMPGMNGKQLRDKMSIFQPRIKALYMSGYTADVIAHHGIINEDVEFLQKPFTVMALAQRVREVLEKP